MVAFISAPIVGRYGAKVGSKVISTAFVFTTAVCSISFGFLIYIHNTVMFLVAAHAIRLLTGIAMSGAYAAFYDIYTKTFPNKVSKLMAASDLSMGLGYMLGMHRWKERIFSYIYNGFIYIYIISYLSPLIYISTYFRAIHCNCYVRKDGIHVSIRSDWINW